MRREVSMKKNCWEHADCLNRSGADFCAKAEFREGGTPIKKEKGEWQGKQQNGNAKKNSVSEEAIKRNNVRGGT